MVKGGQSYIPISKQGKEFLAKGKLSKLFWRRFEREYPSLSRKRQGNASDKRVIACSEAIARSYLDELAEELISMGIFKSSGLWMGDIDTSRILNHDEMPQFIDYGVSDSAVRGLVYCGQGDKCERLTKENPECITIEPYVSFDGNIIMNHVIFPGTWHLNQQSKK